MPEQGQRRRVWLCAPCAADGIDHELDLETPGTKDALWHVVSPTHESRYIGVCGPHAEGKIRGASLWELSQMGEEKKGGTMRGPDKFPWMADVD